MAFSAGDIVTLKSNGNAKLVIGFLSEDDSWATCFWETSEHDIKQMGIPISVLKLFVGEEMVASADDLNADAGARSTSSLGELSPQAQQTPKRSTWLTGKP